jgi:hypothetical protein
MEDIYYLIHTTNDPDCINWAELRTSEFNVDDQFPGVYLSLITKDNIDNEYIFPGKYLLIFSKKLLFQKNYHINLTDYNGIISEKNTYFPWNLDKFISQSKQSLSMPQNEVVFHDNIDMKYCCSIISVLKKPIHIKINNFLPKLSIENDNEPNMTKEPFYCYPFEDIYTGDEEIPKSSNKWYEMMANMCKIDTNNMDTPEDIVSKIKDRANEIYNNREIQNINLLKEYTNSVNRGGKKSRSKRKVKKNKKTVRKIKYL